MQKIVYATTDPLARAKDVYTDEELAIKGLSPEAKITANGQTSIKFHQAWKRNTAALLSTDSWEELMAIEDKTVAIVHGLCNPPLITIDPDNYEKAEALMEIVSSLPEDQQPLVISKGVGKAGYNFTYHDTIDNELMKSYVYSIHSGGLGDDLDVLASSDKVMFMANKGNKTKELVAVHPTTDIRPVPKILQYAVMALFKDKRPSQLDVAKERGAFLPEHTTQSSQLGFMFKGFNPSDSTTEILLASFIANRTKYDLKENFKYPADEPYPYKPRYYTAKPHDLLLRLSGSLKNDPGIDPQQHTIIIQTINSMLPHSKNLDHLQSEILMPDLKEPYTYNKDWESVTASVYNDYKQVVDIYRVTARSNAGGTHMLHNTATGEVRLFPTASALKEELAGEVSKPKKMIAKVQEKARLIDIIERPNHPFGLLPLEKHHVRHVFNMYRRTSIQEMFYNPDETTRILKHKYNHPDTIIKAIESQMGKEKTHRLFLPFIKRKLLTREPSPLIFALMGPPHSFKTALVEGVLKELFSPKRYLKAGSDVLTDKFNDFVVNLDILLIDEIHHLINTRELKLVIQMLNKFGSEYHEGIRAMHTSIRKGEEIAQEITPFITMNRVVVPASETVGERRLIVGYSTKPVREYLNMEDPDIKDKVKGELLDFAYYLAKYVDPISKKDYGHNARWKEVDDHYYKFMNKGISKLKRLALAIGSTVDLPNLDAIQELMEPRPLSECLIKLQRASHGSQYRLRLWNADGSYSHMTEVPGVVDDIEEIDYRDVPKMLEMNDNVLKPSMVSSTIRQNKQDLVVTEAVLRAYNLLTEDGDIIGQNTVEPIGELEL